MKKIFPKLALIFLLILLAFPITSPNVVGEEKDNRVMDDGFLKSLENRATGWMYGTHVLLHGDEPIYALRSDVLSLEDFEGKDVTIEGVLVHRGLEGGPPLVEVKSVEVKEGGPPTIPPTFNVSNLSIVPNEVKPEENVKISADVNNIGGEKGSHEIELYVDGRFVKKKKVTLNPGETDRVTFTVSREKEGTYTVQAGGFSKTLRVSKSETEEGGGKTGLPLTWIVVGVAIFVALGIGVLLGKRPKEA